MEKRLFNNFGVINFAILFFYSSNVPATELSNTGLCHANEQLVFSCVAGKKTASICASNQVTKERGYMQYRFGSKGKSELVYPTSQQQPNRIFFLSSIGYSGGGETHLRFSINQYDYIIYDRTISGKRDRDGRNFPQFDTGIIVKKNGKQARHIKCADDALASIHSIAYEVLEKEPYEDLGLQ